MFFYLAYKNDSFNSTNWRHTRLWLMSCQKLIKLTIWVLIKIAVLLLTIFDEIYLTASFIPEEKPQLS